jgi:hypothetical protein
MWIWGKIGERAMERGGEGGRELVHGIELVAGFLNRAVPHDAMEPVFIMAPD